MVGSYMLPVCRTPNPKVLSLCRVKVPFDVEPMLSTFSSALRTTVSVPTPILRRPSLISMHE